MSQAIKTLGGSHLTKMVNTRSDFSSFQCTTGNNINDIASFMKSLDEIVNLSEGVVTNSEAASLDNDPGSRKNVQEMIDKWRSRRQIPKPVCLECGRICSNHGNLKQHVKNMHGPPDQWETCHVCQKQCKSRQYLLQHLLQTHGIRQRSRFMRNLGLPLFD